MSFTTEEIYQLISKKNKSVHLEKFPDIGEKFENKNLFNKWIELIKIRDICNISIEEKRATKVIGSSLEASLKIKLDKKKMDLIKNIDLAELCIISSIDIEESKDSSIEVETKKALGNKCPVCWKISQKPCVRHSA